MVYNYSITSTQKCQGVDGYSYRKALSHRIAELYDRTAHLWQYAAKIRGCGDSIIVRRYEGGETEIAHALFCRSRLCPMCAWRRSLKAFGQLSDCMTYLDLKRQLAIGKPYGYILIGLTIRNCDPLDLPEIIDHLLESFARLRRTPEWKHVIRGAHRTLEVTYNPNTITMHPHLHIIAAVDPSYFKSRYYISQEKLTQLWQTALKVAYVPVVDIRKVRITPERKDISEVTKYVTKATDWDKLDESESVLSALHGALHGRKLYANYGVIREASRVLKQSDEDGDLLDVGELDSKIAKNIRKDLCSTLEAYTYIPATGYVRIASAELSPWQRMAWSELLQNAI